MTLPAPNLDDLRFQSDLVDEARKRIIHYCPEWTDYNLSDPGITLIELFAWMTELMTYRLNRVPERNHIKFLEMLGFQLIPAKSAEANLTFWLSAMLPLSPDDKTSVVVPAGCEVQSEQQPDPVIFSTSRQLTIVPPILKHLRTENEFNKNCLSRLGIEIFYPFDRENPKEGDTFYLGFDDENNISGHILRLEFSCDPTEAVGIRREDPPWVWECMTEEGWEEVVPSKFDGEKDTTGGLNNENGAVILYLPLTITAQELHGLKSFWLRCRIHQKDHSQGMYTEAPRVKSLEVYTIGAQVPATNSQVIEDELIGESTGEPGQRFTMLHSPVLTPMADETVAVEEDVNGEIEFVPWTIVADFANSTKYDRHFILDTASGTVIFGPSVRQSDGTVLQYGRVPENGRRIAVTKYRYGGGVQGNLPENSINTMGMSLAYISRAANISRAKGGRDQETMEELIYRAQRELQAQKRAVTAADFEQFALNSSRKIARAFCVPIDKSKENAAGTVNVVVVPDVVESLMEGDLHSLHIDDDLRALIRGYLDQYRLLTTTLKISEPSYIGVSVNAVVVPYPFAQANDVIASVDEVLNRYLCPLPGKETDSILARDGEWKGWIFGRSLFKAEIVSLIQRIPMVQYVLDVTVSSRSVNPVMEEPDAQDLTENELQNVEKVLLIPPDGLICSLPHTVTLTTLDDFVKEAEK